MKDANQFSAKATMKDVAERAGVGLGTVSRVVNGFRVKDSTYEKVQTAIRELNYQPDEYARGLKTNRSNIVVNSTEGNNIPRLLFPLSTSSNLYYYELEER